MIHSSALHCVAQTKGNDMKKWNATMPRQMAKEGGADVVLAFRMPTSGRYELTCKMSEEDASALFNQAVEMMAKYKETPTTAKGE